MIHRTKKQSFTIEEDCSQSYSQDVNKARVKCSHPPENSCLIIADKPGYFNEFPPVIHNFNPLCQAVIPNTRYCLQRVQNDDKSGHGSRYSASFMHMFINAKLSEVKIIGVGIDIPGLK